MSFPLTIEFDSRHPRLFVVTYQLGDGRYYQVVAAQRYEGEDLLSFLRNRAMESIREVFLVGDTPFKVVMASEVVLSSQEGNLGPMRASQEINYVTHELPMNTQENLARYLRDNKWTVYKRKVKEDA